MGAPCCNTAQAEPACPGLPAPCEPCPRAAGCSTFPSRTQKPSLPERYTSLLPAEKTPPGVQQGAQGSQELPQQQQHQGRRLSQAGWGARHPAQHPMGTCAAPGAAARGSPGGCWPGPQAVSCLLLVLMAHLSKLTLAHPGLGRPNVRRAPSAGQAPGDCKSPREEPGSWRGWHPPWLAGGEWCCAGNHWQCSCGVTSLLGSSHPHCSPLPRSPGPSTVFLAGVTTIPREPGKKHPFAVKGVNRHFSGTSVQVFIIQPNHLQALPAPPFSPSAAPG